MVAGPLVRQSPLNFRLSDILRGNSLLPLLLSENLMLEGTQLLRISRVLHEFCMKVFS